MASDDNLFLVMGFRIHTSENCLENFVLEYLQCENCLKNETARFQALYENFSKEKASHLQALKGTRKISCVASLGHILVHRLGMHIDVILKWRLICQAR